MSKAFPIHVERTADGEYLLSWTEEFSERPVEVRAHARPDAAAAAVPVAGAASSGVRVNVARDGQRHYFHLTPERGESITAAQRDVPLEGGTNFRDLGGYRAADGRRVRWGRLFRSGHTAGLSERDQAHVAALDIRVCCDFRRSEELQVEPMRLPPATRIVSITISPGSNVSFFEQVAGGNVAPADMAAFMESVNREFVHHHSAQYRRMFEELLALDEGGFMINCAAGKDRTGFGAAMILAALGVAEHDILEDYLLSARYFPIEREIERVRRKYAGSGGTKLDVDLILPMMQTRAEYLRAGFDEIARTHGTSERFLADALGIGEMELRVLRERYTA
ncbi:MAG: tyrosine-protein phosphatase [Gammaproteobacteria bacterium]|nr:tyrosine-protein phosphatase [Gammaproteobacteria bacterium]